MKKNPKKKQLYYSDSFKLGVVNRVFNGEMSKEQARRFFVLGATVLSWNG